MLTACHLARACAVYKLCLKDFTSSKSVRSQEFGNLFKDHSMLIIVVITELASMSARVCVSQVLSCQAGFVFTQHADSSLTRSGMWARND